MNSENFEREYSAILSERLYCNLGKVGCAAGPVWASIPVRAPESAVDLLLLYFQRQAFSGSSTIHVNQSTRVT